jgi:hypothetical protein
VVKHRYFAIELPEFNVVAVQEMFCLLHGLGIIGAIERHRSIETAIRTDDVSSVFDHATLPTSERAFRP